jgi:hypothetical protein
VGLLLAGALALTGCSHDESVTPPKPGPSSTDARGVSAQRILTELAAALTARDGTRAAALAAPEGRPVVAAMVANARTLDLRDLSLRFVDDQSALSADDRTRYGATAWAATADLSYRIGGWDAHPARLETRFVFLHSGGRDLLAGAGGGEGRTPIWLTGRVDRAEAGRALVLSRAPSPGHYLALASQALVDVAKVLPRWHGRLVLEVPADETGLDQALGATQEQYANIAAVTTTVDGSLVPGTPVHVFLNPRVFDALGPRGAQVVLSHETTHVATDAAFADLPAWLLEGFADYVALAHAAIPVSTAASQILARIRKDGPPDHLPTAAELDPTANGLGATYEEAWLATRFLAQQYGEAKLVAFYRTVGGGEDVGKAFHTILGTSESAFVTRWRADLRHLAGGVAG